MLVDFEVRYMKRDGSIGMINTRSITWQFAFASTLLGNTDVLAILSVYNKGTDIYEFEYR